MVTRSVDIPPFKGLSKKCNSLTDAGLNPGRSIRWWRKKILIAPCMGEHGNKYCSSWSRNEKTFFHYNFNFKVLFSKFSFSRVKTYSSFRMGSLYFGLYWYFLYFKYWRQILTFFCYRCPLPIAQAPSLLVMLTLTSTGFITPWHCCRFLPVHRSEKFWRENADRLNEKNYEILKMLIKLLETSQDPLVLSVASFDLGEYVRHYPRGKQWV